MDMISSTKVDSASHTNLHASTENDEGNKNYQFNAGSPSLYSKKRHSAREDSPNQPTIPKNGSSFAQTLQAEISKLRPTTA